MSKNYLEVLNYIPYNKNTASIIISNAYNAMLEILNALLSLYFFKSYSHKCIVYFLREILREEKLGRIFDRNRKLRNAINYYGMAIESERAVFAVKEIKLFIKIIRKKYFKNK